MPNITRKEALALLALHAAPMESEPERYIIVRESLTYDAGAVEVLYLDTVDPFTPAYYRVTVQKLTDRMHCLPLE